MRGWVWQVRVDSFVIVILGCLFLSQRILFYETRLLKLIIKWKVKTGLTWTLHLHSENWIFLQWWRLKMSNNFYQNFHQYPFHIVTNLQLYSKLIHILSMNAWKVPAKCNHIDFLHTISVIFLPFCETICLRQLNCDEHIEYVRVQIVNWKSWDNFLCQ